jgi:thioredoxin reductase (NADPH)
LTLSSGALISARSVVIASGVRWRRLPVPSLEAHLGRGVFYGAAGSEAAALHGQDVIVIGGGNSAGQAAVHLAKHAAQVRILSRRDLTATMSTYLIQEIENTDNITVLTDSEVTEGGGANQLEWVTIRLGATATTSSVAAVFVMIGAEPHTDWLPADIQRDQRGYLLTGVDVSQEGWTSSRPPMFQETSMPGVFAVGDVAHDSTKRVAPSVGSGAIAIQLVHRYLAEQATS